MASANPTHSPNGIRIFDLPHNAKRPNDPPRKVAMTYMPNSWNIVYVDSGAKLEPPYAINWGPHKWLPKSEDGFEAMYLYLQCPFSHYTGLKEALVKEGIIRETDETASVVRQHPHFPCSRTEFIYEKVFVTLKPTEIVRQCNPCKMEGRTGIEGFGAGDTRFMACGGCHLEFYCSKKCQRDAWIKGNHKKRCKPIGDRDEAALAVLEKGELRATYTFNNSWIAEDRV